MNITETELLDAIQEATKQASARPDGALTVAEMSDSMGLSRGAVRNRVVPLVRSGRMECVWVMVTDITGRFQRLPAYRLIAPKKKGKR